MPPNDAVAAAMKRRRSLRQPEQVAAARRFVAEALARGSEFRETARLLVSETVTSTLDQARFGMGGGTFEIAYAIVGGRIRVEVSDDGGPARLRRRIHGVQAESGRGLRLVHTIASRWGIREGTGGRTIWFELNLRAAGERRRPRSALSGLVSLVPDLTTQTHARPALDALLVPHLGHVLLPPSCLAGRPTGTCHRVRGGSDVTDERRPRRNLPPDQRPDPNEEFRRRLERETDLSLREDPQRRRFYRSGDLPRSGPSSDDRPPAAMPHSGVDVLTWDGETLTLIGWSQRTGLRVETLLRRCRKGWSVEQVLTMPPKEGRVATPPA